MLFWNISGCRDGDGAQEVAVDVGAREPVWRYLAISALNLATC